jgi:uncharacterized membrane protein YidH (DUF202 family)
MELSGASKPATAAHEDLSVVQMVAANRPWRLVSDLAKVLVAALASAGFFIVNSNAWSISDQLSVPRLVLIAVLALGGLAVWLVVGHELWERVAHADDPQLTRRVNAATGLTLFVGLVIGYVVLFGLVLFAMAVAVPDQFVKSNLGHSASFGDYVAAAWLACSLATVAGAIGSGLESDDDVRETITRYRPDPERF